MMAAKAKVAQLEAEPQEHVRSRTHWERAWQRLRRDRLTLGALIVILVLSFSCIFAEPITTYVLHTDPVTENLENIYQLPFQSDSIHYLGTDNKGRDHLARLLFGGRVSLTVAFFAAVLSLSIGITLGMITGYYGGIVDDLINWFITTLGSIPSLFLLLIIASVFTPGPVTLTVVLGLLGWTGTLRLVRGETLSLREREFIVAARAMGASGLRIMFQHIFPNLISLVVITLAIDIGALILTETALSYLGFGITPPTPSWGNMLTLAQEFFKQAPILVIMPGLLISGTVLCLFIIGDGIRDALDPTLSE